jgi:hypothetical protein
VKSGEEGKKNIKRSIHKWGVCVVVGMRNAALQRAVEIGS